MVLITSARVLSGGSLRSGISPFNVGMVEALAGIAVVTWGECAEPGLERKTDRLMVIGIRPMAWRRIWLALGCLSVFWRGAGLVYLARVTNPLTGTC